MHIVFGSNSQVSIERKNLLNSYVSLYITAVGESYSLFLPIHDIISHVSHFGELVVYMGRSTVFLAVWD